MITGEFFLDWGILAVSLFNTVLLLWLGGAVILNAERRTWGMALAGGGLLFAGILFLAHTAILGRGVANVPMWMGFWWVLGWLPASAAPFIWYVEMLWYSGYWQGKRTQAGSQLRGLHRAGLILTGLMALALIGLPLFDRHPLPTYAEIPRYNLSSVFSLGRLPLLILIYPVYATLCFALSISALRRPRASHRVMGEMARIRARPWLAATALVLLAVSLIGTSTLLWFIGYGREEPLYLTDRRVLLTVAWLDLVISTLIAVAILLLGQAVTRYEIFTGRVLPRRGLANHWRSAVVLAAGYGMVVAASLALHVHPIYALLMATLLMVVFYVLFSWRSYVERERYMRLLRPFAARAAPSLFEEMIAGTTLPLAANSETPEPGMLDPFKTLCREVLGTRFAYLAAVGALSPLAGEPLIYRGVGASEGQESKPLSIAPLIAELNSPQTICLAVDPAEYAGAHWAVPLWNERGIIGVFLLGEKQDGSIYAQEEIEIARAVGERLLDTHASVAIAQRLMALQRRHLVESQVMDRSARRVLHDEVLPLLHTAMLTLGQHSTNHNGKSNGHSGESDGTQETLSLLAEAHRQTAELLREMPKVSLPIDGTGSSSGASTLASQGLARALRMLAEDEMRGAFDSVSCRIAPEVEEMQEDLSPLAAEIVYYAAREAIRNAANHGRLEGGSEPFALTVTASCPNGLEVSVEDNGTGIDSRVEGKEVAGTGAGQGLALHSTLLAIVGGSLSISSIPGRFTRVTLSLPAPTEGRYISDADMPDPRHALDRT